MYREVLRLAGAPQVVLGSALARLPLGAAPLAIVLLVSANRSSFALAGLTAAAYAVAKGAFAPVLGRLVDRRGASTVLVPGAAAQAVTFATLGIVVDAGGPGSAIVVLGAVSGAAQPPVSACTRNVWANLAIDTRLRDAAYALDAVVLEIVFISGPLLVGGIAAIAGAFAALLALTACTLAGSVVFIRSTRSALAPREGSNGRSNANALKSKGLRVLVAVGVPWGISFAALEVLLPAFARQEGDAAGAGILIALVGAGSIVGGVVYGQLRWSVSPATRYITAISIYAGALALLPWAHSYLTVAPLTFAAGLGLAPASAAVMAILDDVVSAEQATEAYTWLVTSNVVGASGGYALAGFVVESAGLKTGFMVALGFCAAGAALAVAGYGALRPARTTSARPAADAVGVGP